MKKLLSVPLPLVVAAVSLLSGGQQARADGYYGSFVVRNSSNVPINYQVRWGDGDWESYCVQPHCSRSHYHELDEDGRAPSPQVRFDYIAGDDDVTYKTYKMSFYETNYPSMGKPYVFRYSRCGCYLDLYGE